MYKLVLHLKQSKFGMCSKELRLCSYVLVAVQCVLWYCDDHIAFVISTDPSGSSAASCYLFQPPYMYSHHGFPHQQGHYCNYLPHQGQPPMYFDPSMQHYRRSTWNVYLSVWHLMEPGIMCVCVGGGSTTYYLTIIHACMIYKYNSCECMVYVCWFLLPR